MATESRPHAQPGSSAPGRELLSIGRFARLSGLSIGALRHYDEMDLLRPARVDPSTGYRSYAQDQLERARLIARLRDLEMPLDEVRAAVEADDPAERRRLLTVHRARVEARTYRLQRVLHALLHLSARGGDSHARAAASARDRSHHPSRAGGRAVQPLLEAPGDPRPVA